MSPIPSVHRSNLHYIPAPSLASVERGSAELGVGNDGGSVKALQELLNRAGANPPLVPDGSFGPLTETALRSAQQELGLAPTGVAGRSTFELLRQRTSAFSRTPDERPGSHGPSVAPRIDQPPPAGTVRPGEAARRNGSTIDRRASQRPPTPAVRTSAPRTTSTARTTTTPPRTWDHAAGTRGGVYLSEHGNATASLERANARFPGAGTFLWYKSVDGSPSDLPPAFFQRARAAGVVPQVAFESNKHTLTDMNAALKGKGQLPTNTGDANVDAKNEERNAIYRQMVAWADHLKGQGPVVFRPFSEMNDASGAWELGAGKGNTPELYAQVWNGMHQLFDERGATNLRWSFDVLAGKGGPAAMRGNLVEETLRRIPPGYIDDVSMNPYARMQPNGEYTPFKQLVDPWISMFERTGHGNARPMISEMGVSNNALVPNGSAFYAQHRNDAALVAPGTAEYDRVDAARAKWIHDAFAYARAQGYSTVTYFTQMNTNWRVDPGSRAERALQEELAK